MLDRRLATLASAAVLALALPASAGAAPPPHKCNAGTGNGSEGLMFHDCDPGNSSATNRAAD